MAGLGTTGPDPATARVRADPAPRTTCGRHASPPLRLVYDASRPGSPPATSIAPANTVQIPAWARWIGQGARFLAKRLPYVGAVIEGVILGVWLAEQVEEYGTARRRAIAADNARVNGIEWQANQAWMDRCTDHGAIAEQGAVHACLRGVPYPRNVYFVGSVVRAKAAELAERAMHFAPVAVASLQVFLTQEFHLDDDRTSANDNREPRVARLPHPNARTRFIHDLSALEELCYEHALPAAQMEAAEGLRAAMVAQETIVPLRARAEVTVGLVERHLDYLQIGRRIFEIIEETLCPDGALMVYDPKSIEEVCAALSDVGYAYRRQRTKHMRDMDWPREIDEFARELEGDAAFEEAIASDLHIRAALQKLKEVIRRFLPCAENVPSATIHPFRQ